MDEQLNNIFVQHWGDNGTHYTQDVILFGDPIGKTIISFTQFYMMLLYESQDIPRECFLLLRSLDGADVIPVVNGDMGKRNLIIKCKDLRCIVVKNLAEKEASLIKDFIRIFAHIATPQLNYPFFYQPDFTVLENGWDAFLPEMEYSNLLQPFGLKLSSANYRGKICQSYPAVLLIPQHITDHDLTNIGQFRRRGRFPVPSFIHPVSHAALLRSAEPKVGSVANKCLSDQKLLDHYIELPERASRRQRALLSAEGTCRICSARPGAPHFGIVLDLRGSGAVKQRQQREGGGTELPDYYPRWKVEHCQLQPAEASKAAIETLAEAIIDPEISADNWLKQLDKSGWLHQVWELLRVSIRAADCISDGHSTLVHCSDGFDGPLQVTALAQLIMHHDARSIRGFLALIEREWVQAGHPFRTRCQHGPYSRPINPSEGKAAPSFLLFLDAVWQCYSQFPSAFGFTPALLATIARHAYASEFGTFICDNENERIFCKDSTVEINAKKRTTSLWSFLLLPKQVELYQNPLYTPPPPSTVDKTPLPPQRLRLKTSASAIKVWPFFTEAVQSRPRVNDQLIETVYNVDTTILEAEILANLDAEKREVKRLARQVKLYQTEWERLSESGDSGHSNGIAVNQS